MKKVLQSFTLIMGLLFFCNMSSYARGVGSANVKFGAPNEKTGNCSGKGVCMLTNIGSMQGNINIDFELLPEIGGTRDMVMTFNINDLRVADPEQALLFVNKAGEPQANYNMDYTFTNRELCNELGVAPGDMEIRSTDQNVIELLSNSQVRITYRIPSRR